jgi:hypothetical protein
MSEWYYYSGSVPQAIQVAPGRSVAVRPRSKIEVQSLTPDVAALVARGVLVRTGRPVGAVAAAPAPAVTPAALAAVLTPPEWVRSTADRGVTPAAGRPPQDALGFPAQVLAIEGAQAGTEAGAGVEGTAEANNKRKGKRR